MGDTERLIDSLLSLGSENLLDFVAQFKPTSAAGLQAAAKASANDAHAMEHALLQCGDTNVDCPDDRMWTPLMTAAAAGNERVMDVLLRNGASWERQNEDGEAPLHLALKNGHVPCVALLLERNCDPNVRTSSGATPLIVAGHDIAAMQLLLDASGSSVDSTDQNGCTALIHAARGGHYDATRLLLERGASPSAADKRGATALHHAAETGALESVALLLRAGASTDAAAGQTPCGAAMAACAKGGSLRHLAVVELLESYANGEDLTAQVLQMADQTDESLPEPGSVMDVLHEVRWSKAGVAMQAHEDEGVRAPRPFSKAQMDGSRRERSATGGRAGKPSSVSNYSVKVPLKILERLYVRQENRRGALTPAGKGMLAQPAAPQPVPPATARRQPGVSWSPDVVERLNCAGRAANAPAPDTPPLTANSAGDGATACTDAVRLAFKRAADDTSSPELRMDAFVAAVAAVTQMKRGKLPAETLPPKCMTALLSRATEQIVGTLCAATNSDDVDAMVRALRHSKSHHARLVDALGGSQLPRELGQRVEVSTHECESRKDAVISAFRRMNAAWRAGHPAEISASIAAAISLSLPPSDGSGPSEVDDSMQRESQGTLLSKAQELKAKLGGLVQTQRLLHESCNRLGSGVAMDATTLARNIKLISECSKFEATASSTELRRLQSAVAEMYAMAEEGAGKENVREERDDSTGNHRGSSSGGAAGLLVAPTTTQTQARMKLESKALLAQRRVETRSADAATRRAAAREARAHHVEAQLAQSRSTLQQQQRDLRASIASKEERALQNQLALSEERAQRLARYADRELKAAATKADLEAQATAKMLATQAALEQRYVLRSVDSDSRDGEERLRVAQHRRDSVAQRRGSMETQRQSRLEARLEAKLLSSKGSTAGADNGALAISEGQSGAGAKGTAAFLSTTRTQRESVLVSYSGGTSHDNNPKFYPAPVSAGAAADPDAVWRETAFPYPEQDSLTPVKQRRQVVGRWISKP